LRRYVLEIWVCLLLLRAEERNSPAHRIEKSALVAGRLPLQPYEHESEEERTRARLSSGTEKKQPRLRLLRDGGSAVRR
jgi:hypothetical protein